MRTLLLPHKLFAAFSLLAGSAAVAQEAQPNPARLNAIIQEVVVQRNAAFDQYALCAADLSLAQQEIGRLKNQIAELQKQPANPQTQKEDRKE